MRGYTAKVCEGAPPLSRNDPLFHNQSIFASIRIIPRPSPADTKAELAVKAESRLVAHTNFQKDTPISSLLSLVTDFLQERRRQTLATSFRKTGNIQNFRFVYYPLRADISQNFICFAEQKTGKGIVFQGRAQGFAAPGDGKTGLLDGFKGRQILGPGATNVRASDHGVFELRFLFAFSAAVRFRSLAPQQPLLVSDTLSLQCGS